MSATAPSPNSPPSVNSAPPPVNTFPTADSNPTAVSPASPSNNSTNTPPTAATPPPQSTPTVPVSPPPSVSQPPPSPPPDTQPPPSPPPPSSPPPDPLLPLPLTPPDAPPPADNPPPPPPPLVVLPTPSPKNSPPPPPVVSPPPPVRSSPTNPSPSPPPPPPAPVEPQPSSPPPKASPPAKDTPSPPPPVPGAPPRSPPADSPPSSPPPPPSDTSPPSETSPPPPHANPPKDSPPTPSLPPPPGALPSAPPPPVLTPPDSTAPPPSVLAPPNSVAAPPPSVLAPPNSIAAPPPSTLAPPDSTASPPPSVIAPPNSTAPTPPSIPTSSLPPSLSPPAPQNNSSSVPTTPGTPVPSHPAEKPTARVTTPGPNITTGPTTRDAGGVQSGGAVAIGLVGFFALSLVVFAVWFVQKRKKKRSANNLGYVLPSPFASSQHSDSTFLRAQHSSVGSANQSPYHSAQLSGSLSTNSYMNSSDPGGLANSRSWFTYEELGEATNGFSKNNILGEGGFGCVYKGVLADGKEVAVKQLKSGGGQGEREFRAEVEIISRIHHRHLVTLVGYCISDHQRLLVYEFVANDTLHYHLHDKGKAAMTWETRFKVAAGAARGIAYLHEDCTPRVFHRDIKSANILLDNSFEARVADFGLAKLVDMEAQTHVSTRVMGTFGYMAPEYATTGKLTEKSDVFSFGVVLLELITGRKPVDGSQPLGDESLVEWSRPLLNQALENENFEDVIDPRLEKNYVENEVFRMIEAAAACIRHSASKRPRMSQVARALESSNEPSDLTNGTKPGQSQIFDSREHSTQIKLFQKMAFGSPEYSTDFFNDSQSSWRTGL